MLSQFRRPGFDPHALQRRLVRDRRHDQRAVVLEADEAAIEQVIDTGRQEQAVLTVQPLSIARVAPRLAMAGDEVLDPFSASDAAAFLQCQHALLE